MNQLAARTLTVVSIVVGSLLLLLTSHNTSSIMTGAADASPANISIASLSGLGALISFAFSIFTSFKSGSPISGSEIAKQAALKTLFFYCTTPSQKTLLQRLTDELSAIPVTAVALAPLRTPNEYLALIEQAIRKEVASQCYKGD